MVVALIALIASIVALLVTVDQQSKTISKYEEELMKGKKNVSKRIKKS